MIQNHAYLIRRNGIFYFSRRVPADVRSRFNKDRVIISLHTRSLPKAQRSASALSDRLERYWDSIRLEGLGLLGCFFQSFELAAFQSPVPRW